MKKVLALLGGSLAMAAALAFAAPALAASDDPVILHAPQSYQWVEDNSAEYFCTVEEDQAKLFSYQWHIVYNGVDYLVAEANGSRPWEAGAGIAYGVDGDRCFFTGIGTALDGAEIYCVVSGSTGSVESPHARIMVTADNLFYPPEIQAPVTVGTTLGHKVLLEVTGKPRSGNVSEKGDFITYEWMQ